MTFKNIQMSIQIKNLIIGYIYKKLPILWWKFHVCTCIFSWDMNKIVIIVKIGEITEMENGCHGNKPVEKKMLKDARVTSGRFWSINMCRYGKCNKTLYIPDVHPRAHMAQVLPD